MATTADTMSAVATMQYGPGASDRRSRIIVFFFFSSRRRHTRFDCDWSSDVCSSDLDSSTEICNSGTTSGIGKIETDVAPPFPKSCLVSFPYALGDVHVSSNNATGWFAAEIADVGNATNYTNCTLNCTANDNSGLPSNWRSSS